MTVTYPHRLAAVALVALIGLPGCSAPAQAPPAGPAAASSAASSVVVGVEGDVIRGPELARMWDSPTTEPCAQPGPLFSDALQPVADSIGDLPNVDTVKNRLSVVTARGAYVEESLQNLHAALLQTRYNMVDYADKLGSDAPQVVRARDNFAQYLDAVVADLQSGTAPTPLEDFEFDLAGSCGR